MRRVLLLVSSLLIVLALGGVAAWTEITTAGQVSAVHRADRSELQGTLSGLTGQYMQFTFLAAQTAADQSRWSLRHNDPGDRARLAHLVGASPLTSYGASLVSLTGQPLTDYSTGAALPPPTDPGYGPMRAALLAGKPGLSAVMRSGLSPVVAFAVPVHRGKQAVGLLVTYASVRDWPLQGYNNKLSLGPATHPYVVDASGVVAASGDVADVGRPLAGLPATVTGGGSGTTHLRRDGRSVVITYAPAGQGWTALTVQDESAFSGALKAGHRRELVVLLLLLTLVVAVLVLFHHKRQQALRKVAEDRLYDPLTGLAQRRLFDLRVEAAFSRQRRSGAPLVLLYCDLDDFKSVNDRHGHNTGDELLTLVARRLEDVVREDDLVARLGGDEFAVLLEGTTAAEAEVLVQRLYDHVQVPAVLHTVTLEPRLSIGGAVLLDNSRADELLHAADLAMYQVKTSGQNRSTVMTRLGPVPGADAVAGLTTPGGAAPLLRRP